MSRTVQAWIRSHNQQVKRDGRGVQILLCFLPVKSPRLNPIEPHWVHVKRCMAERTRLLSATELEQRVCAAFNVPRYDHLTTTNDAA